MAAALSNPRILRPAAGATAWLLLGLTGLIGAGWGYGLFFASMLLLAGAAVAVALLALTRAFDTDRLRGSAAWLGIIGVWTYVWAVGALAGHYTHETFAGRMELRWVLFGPAVLAALVVLDVGLYRMLVGKNLPSWHRYRGVIRRELANPRAMRRTLIDDVILHRTLFSVSGFRWLKHTLIFWGFALMFAAELLAVVVREGFPAFGWTDLWEMTSHPVRLAFDFVYDFTGLMVLVGCALAIGWRIKVNGTGEQKFTDTPTAVFLFLVVLSGFVVEGMRLAAVPGAWHGVLLRGQRGRASGAERGRAGLGRVRDVVAGARPRLVRVHRLRAGEATGAFVRNADGAAHALAARAARGEEERGARRPDGAAPVTSRRGTTESARPDWENVIRHGPGREVELRPG